MGAGGSGAVPSIVPRVTVFTATAIAIADMIGIGVFTSLGFQVRDIQTGFSLLMLWVVGGLAALSGAVCYAELAAMFPRSGGEYNFLSRAYHPAVGFMAGWLSATVGFAAPIALAAMAFGAYLKGILPSAPSATVSALAITWAITLVRLSGARPSAAFQDIATVFKVVLIAGFIVAAFAFGEPQPVTFVPQAADWSSLVSMPFAISLVFVMYSYSGWNASTYIVGDMANPQRDAPRALILATVVVMALYVGLNAAFIYTTPLAMLAGKIEVAQVVGAHIFGPAGGRVVAALICFGLISAISAMVWIGPAVTKAIGEDIAVLRPLASTSASGVPVPALVLQLAIVTVMILTQSFERVLEFVQFALTLSSFLTVAGVMVLRRTRPDIERPYRAWGYPFTPLVFLAITGFMLAYLMVGRPLESLASLGLFAAGLALYVLTAGRAAGGVKALL
ncbi:MAG: amino acid permease [Hyphomicrobiaceae bacterium]